MKDDLEKKCVIYEIEMMRKVTGHPRCMKTFCVYEGENYIYCLCELFRG